MELLRVNFWRGALERHVSLNEISDEEVERVQQSVQDLVFIAGLTMVLEGRENFSEDDVISVGKVIQTNLVLESLRRKFASNRPNLFFLRDLPVSNLGRAQKIPEIEFMRGLARTIQEKTGKEMTGEEVARRVNALMSGEEN